ncbi:MAG: carbamate kinase [Defluviitaleaceae bacterium]|nr:carbamate kinase [Defluviitaleaceae bacterium]
MSTVVVALGGNALGNNVKEQLEMVKQAAKSIVDFVASGHKVVVAHGNGPQVGMIKLLMDAGKDDMPLVECIAMSQGYIGYHIQQAIRNELAARGINKEVATIPSQTVVDKNDPAFLKPTKPIGAYSTEEEAKQIMAETGKHYMEDAGRGWRWAVASPKPIDIVEKHVVKKLLDDDAIVIACGGGGTPVYDDSGAWKGIDAVVDKDFASAKMAELIGADTLIILTAVEHVALNYTKPDHKDLGSLTVADAKKYEAEGHFAPGSMLPKVQACVGFIENGGKKAIIAALEKAQDAIAGKSGTTFQ